MTSFAELGLAEPILKALEGEGYTKPTPIQAKAIPTVLAGRDLLGIAQTGTGKTAAFALPILHRLAMKRQPAPRRGCRTLVLSPTRELATQIADSFRAYGRHLGMSVSVVFGGMPHRPQIQAISRGVDILIATPGRLIDHMEGRHIALEGTEIFVLDEADQMLDLGFLKPIRRIVSHLTARRQNLFFSATMPAEIAGLAGDLLNNPEKVAITPVATTAERVSQRVIHVEASRKRALLTELLASPDMARTLVFTRTKRGADRVARHLETAGMSVASIHGNKSQRQRETALEAFRTARISVLVATDIAARGIDINLVTHVVNYELPEVPEAYVHRIGRTARAGASGSAISLCDGAERDLLRAIERLTRQTIPSEDRRNDATLAADRTTGAAPRSENSTDEGRDRRPERHHNGKARPQAHGARPNGARQGGDPDRKRDWGGERGAHARNGREDRRPPRHARSFDKAPQNGEALNGEPHSMNAQRGQAKDGGADARRHRRDGDGRNGHRKFESRKGERKEAHHGNGHNQRDNDPARSSHRAHASGDHPPRHERDRRTNEAPSSDRAGAGALPRQARFGDENRNQRGDHGPRRDHGRDDRKGNRPLRRTHSAPHS